MSKVCNIHVTALFGYADHTVELRTDAPTIITAPNGAGKTHILTLTRAALSLDLKSLFHIPFETLTITRQDGTALHVRREEKDSNNHTVTIQAIAHGADCGSPLTVTEEQFEALSDKAPNHFKPVGENRWINLRTGNIVGADQMERRYGIRLTLPTSLLQKFPEISEFCKHPSPIFIDTKRLDAPQYEAYQRSSPTDAIRTRKNDAASRIREYTERLRFEVSEARRDSVHATQSADLSFAARALEAANETVKEADLKERYATTVERYEALARNGLAVGEAPIDFPEKTTPTVRRILRVFLDDWDNRLKPLLPLNEKIQALREVLDSKLEPSGKKTAMSPRGTLEFRTSTNRPVRVSNLSSGEQHLVALFTSLLFSASRGSLVLIDEPEISLHAAWKHDFLTDIARVAKVGKLQIVLATHSTAIINGRWDLTEELKLSMPTESTTEISDNGDSIFEDVDGDDYDE